VQKLFHHIFFLYLLLGLSLLEAKPLLIENYPFGPPLAKTDNGNKLTENKNSVGDMYNLLGYFTYQGTTNFILMNSSTKKTFWLPRDNEKNSAKIIKWNPEAKRLTVEVNGFTQTLIINKRKDHLNSVTSSFEQKKPVPSPAKRLRRPRKLLQ